MNLSREDMGLDRKNPEKSVLAYKGWTVDLNDYGRENSSVIIFQTALWNYRGEMFANRLRSGSPTAMK